MSSCPAFTSLESTATLPALPNRSGWLSQPMGQARVVLQWMVAQFKTLPEPLPGWDQQRLDAHELQSADRAVSAFDTYLTIKYAESLDIYEQNPLGRWLMGLDQGPVCETQQIAAFITAKFVGTLLVLLVIQGLAYWRIRVAGLVATPIAMAQLYLVLHLVFGEG